MRGIYALCLATLALGCGRSLPLADDAGPSGVRILTVQLPNAQLDSPYDQLLASVGAGPHAWSIVTGALPPGLELQPDGARARIAGRPLDVGTFSFGIRLTGAGGAVDEVAYTIVVSSDRPLSIVTPSIADGRLGELYVARVEATGGVGRRFWTVFQGRLNDGLTLTEIDGNVEIRGTPRQSGSRTFGLRVQDAAGNVAERSFTIVIEGDTDPLRIVTSDLPMGSMRQRYEAQIVADGGTSPYAWAVVEGSLPPGTSLQTSGTPGTRLTGRPIRAGGYEFTVEVIDTIGVRARADFFVFIESDDALEILTGQLPTGRVGQPYFGTVGATPGAGPYSWTVTGLPPDLTTLPTSFDEVQIRGTPRVAGAVEVQFRVGDGLGRSASRSIMLEVVDDTPPLSVITTALPAATLGQPYQTNITAGGGRPPYTWSVSGVLPTGMILDANGTPSTRLGGTPGQMGSFVFVVTVSDRDGASADASLTFNVGSGDPLQIDTTTMPTGAPCTEYVAPLEASGGSRTNYVWSLSQGSLPTGLTLQTSGTPSTVISGVPQQSGSFPIGITVTDSNMGTATRAFVVQVSTSPGPRFALFSGLAPNSPVGRLHAVDLCAPTPSVVEITSPVGSQTGVQRQDGALVMNAAGTVAAYAGEDGTRGIHIVDLRSATPSKSSVLPAFAGPRTAYLYWSPDGTKLAFRSDAEAQGRFDLYVVDVSDPANPGPARRLNPITQTQGDVMTSVSWSPDSRRIAFIGDVVFDNRLELFVAEVFTSSQSVQAVSGNLSGTQDVLNFAPVWNAGSNRLFFAGFIRGSKREVFWVDIVPTLGVPTPVRMNNPDFATLSAYHPSPDRRWLVYVADETLANTFELYRVDMENPAGTIVTVNSSIPANRRVSVVKWNSASTQLVYTVNGTSTSRGDLYLTNVSGPPPIRLDQSPMNGGGIRQTPDSVLWTPDDRGVVFLVDANTAFRFEPFFVDVSGSTPTAQMQVGPHTVRSNTRTMKFAREVAKLFLVVEPPNSGPRELFVADLSPGGSGSTVRVMPANAVFSVPIDPNLLAPQPFGIRTFFALGTGFAGTGSPYISSPTFAAPTALTPNAFNTELFLVP